MHDARGGVYHARAMMRRLFYLWAVGICAVAAAPCQAQDDELQSRVQDALDMARPALVAHLEAASSGVRPGELALVLLAALHDGVPPQSKPMQRAMARLAKARIDETYDLALRLLVLEACPTFPGRDKLAKADARRLLSHRGAHGAFQYRKRPSTWDLSNTQYGALGLRAAAAMGHQIKREVWLKLARKIGEQQTMRGGFGYSPKKGGAGRPTASMTVAGIAVLAICREALGQEHRRSKAIGDQIDAAWKWFEQSPEIIGSSKVDWCFYMHYGLERAAILCDLDVVAGSVHWYEAGARMLIDAQLTGGGWQSTTDGFPGSHLSKKRGDSVPTAFAILFLRRKFQKLSGPVTPNVVRLVNIGPRSKPKGRRRVRAPVDRARQGGDGRGAQRAAQRDTAAARRRGEGARRHCR